MTDRTFFVVTRIGGTVILLAGLACLGWGGFRLADQLWFQATSVPGRGEVVDVREREMTGHDSDTHESYTQTTTYPIVRFRSPVDGRIHRSESAIGIGRDPPRVGAVIGIRASTRDPGDARPTDLLRRFVVPALVLLLGLFATLMPALFWHMPNPARREGESMSILRGVTVFHVAVPILVLGSVAAAGFRWPWLAATVLGDFYGIRGELLAHPPAPGQLLSPVESAMAKVPLQGEHVAAIAVLSAIDDERHADLKRYLDAWRDPAIRFPLPRGDRYLVVAARQGNAEAVRLLAKAGVDPRRAPEAIEEAVTYDKPGAIRALAEVGAAPADEAARQALVESATRYADDETLLALVEVGWLRPDDGLDPRYWNGEGKVPVLDVTLILGHVRSSRELRRRGAVPTIPFLAHAVAGELAEMRAIVPQRDWPRLEIFGVRFLSLAARAGSVPVVKALVDAGADLTIEDEVHPREPKGTALEQAVRAGHVEVVKLLARAWVEKGLDPAKLGRLVTAAAEKKRWDVVRALVDAGASPNDSDSASPPLHRAVQAGDVALVDYLLSHGADPRAEGGDRLLPIELAKGDAVYAALKEAGGEPAGL